MSTEDESFGVYRRQILADLVQLANRLDTLMSKLDVRENSYDSKLGDLRDRLTTLEVTMKYKAGMWGAVAAMIPTAIAIVWVLMRGH